MDIAALFSNFICRVTCLILYPESLYFLCYTAFDFNLKCLRHLLLPFNTLTYKKFKKII